MAGDSVFDKLVAGLSSNERREMLRRIASSVKMPEAAPVRPEIQDVDVDESYRQMGLWRRIMVLLVALLSGRERESVVEGYLLRDLSRRVAATIPHGFDIAGRQFRPASAADFRSLSEHARTFGPVLSRVMGRERRAFLAFLAGLHAPEAQERLVRDTDPFSIGAAQPELRDADVKRRALGEVDDATTTLPPASRGRIYTDVRVLHQLMTLSAFPFDRMTSVFLPVPGGEPVPAPLARIVDDLARLASAYDGLRVDPSPVLFQALGLYQEQDRLSEDDEAVERILQRNVERLSAAYAGISSFGRKYPLADLVRVAHGNLHYRPTAAGGGEDWYANWKSFWRDRVEQAHHRYAYTRQVDAILGRAKSTLELERTEPFPGYPTSGLDGPARHALSTGLLRTVMHEVCSAEVLSTLGTVYREGEFYKSDNRDDMDRAWQGLQRLKTDVSNLEVRLRATGDLGMSWAQTEDESMPAEAARERRLTLVATIDGDAAAMVRRSVETFHLVGEIVQGVLYGTAGGRYDTLSNLQALGGRSSRNGFLARLDHAHVRCKAAAELLSDLLLVETGSGIA